MLGMKLKLMKPNGAHRATKGKNKAIEFWQRKLRFITNPQLIRLKALPGPSIWTMVNRASG